MELSKYLIMTQNSSVIIIKATAYKFPNGLKIHLKFLLKNFPSQNIKAKKLEISGVEKENYKYSLKKLSHKDRNYTKKGIFIHMMQVN
jgi:hypothetical protein